METIDQKHRKACKIMTGRDGGAANDRRRTWEERARFWEVQRDVAPRVARSVHHTHLQVPKLPAVAVAERGVNSGDSFGIGPGTHYLQAVLLLQLYI